VEALYDIYLDGVWQGSRRTIAQCAEQVYYTVNRGKILEEKRLAKEKEKQDAAAFKQSNIERTRNQEAERDYSGVEALIKQLIKDNPKNANDAKTNPKLIDWFVGQVMKQTKGFKPLVVKDMIKEALSGVAEKV